MQLCPFYNHFLLKPLSKLFKFMSTYELWLCVLLQKNNKKYLYLSIRQKNVWETFVWKTIQLEWIKLFISYWDGAEGYHRLLKGILECTNIFGVD